MLIIDHLNNGLPHRCRVQMSSATHHACARRLDAPSFAAPPPYRRLLPDGLEALAHAEPSSSNAARAREQRTRATPSLILSRAFEQSARQDPVGGSSSLVSTPGFPKEHRYGAAITLHDEANDANPGPDVQGRLGSPPDDFWNPAATMIPQHNGISAGSGRRQRARSTEFDTREGEFVGSAMAPWSLDFDEPRPIASSALFTPGRTNGLRAQIHAFKLISRAGGTSPSADVKSPAWRRAERRDGHSGAIPGSKDSERNAVHGPRMGDARFELVSQVRAILGRRTPRRRQRRGRSPGQELACIVRTNDEATYAGAVRPPASSRHARVAYCTSIFVSSPLAHTPGDPRAFVRKLGLQWSRVWTADGHVAPAGQFRYSHAG
ncbi:hypothetical protein LXA43DRAFT_1094411 [Ganoderma leucocontextum]|nr:hypothetical protein LXA43DRAFT_1094411 [Ganoderma leucocontextum]